MAYHTGVVGSLADLLTAIQNACTGEGWTLDGDVLYKGDCYVKLYISGVTTYLTLQGGTGQSAGTLSGASPSVVRLGATLGGSAISYPVTYHAFIFDDPTDEVYVVANYSTDLYQHLAFGMSNVPDLPGNGTWFFASCQPSSAYMAITSSGGGTTAGGAGGGNSPLLFWRSTSATNANESYVHHGLDGLAWSGYGTDDRATGLNPQHPLIYCLPNTWNDETVLVPINVFCGRAGAKVSLVADLQNARYCRIDYHDPEDVLTLGADEWMIFPAFRKDDTAPDGGSGITHSGTMAVAYRYEP